MNYHCDKLCGLECCVVLAWALCFTDSPEVHHCRKWAPWEYGACTAVADPARLAELMVRALRARGPSVERVDFDKRYDSLADIAVFVDGDSICLETGDDLYTLTMPQARALLAAIMSTPVGLASREQCVRIIRGEA